MERVLELSNTGYFFMSALHANNTNRAMERVMNLFTQDLRKQLFPDLSLNIRVVISLRLVEAQLGYCGARDKVRRNRCRLQ